MVDLLIWITLAICFFGTLYCVQRQGFPQGAWIWWLVALCLIPTWFVRNLNSLTLDPRSMVGIALVLGLLLQPISGPSRFRWLPLDLLVAALVFSQILSQFFARALVPFTTPEVMRDVALPYVVGRLFLSSAQDIPRLFPLFSKMVLILSIYSIIESLTQYNVINKVLGMSWYRLESSEGFRWGLKRAQGNLNHPIYLGLVLAMLLPWVVMAARYVRSTGGPKWMSWTPWLAMIALVGTVSRSAQLCLLAVWCADIFFRYRSLRGPIFVTAVISGLTILTAREEILTALSKYAGEADASEGQVKIRDVWYPYSGTKHRDLLQLAYKDALDQCGWVGYGAELKNMPVEPDMDHRFISIDDHYLVYQLCFGYLGLTLYFMFAGVTCWYLYCVAKNYDVPWAGLAGMMLGSFLGVTIMSKGVSMEPDFRWVWFFTAGVGACMYSWHLDRMYQPRMQPAIYPSVPLREMSESHRENSTLAP